MSWKNKRVYEVHRISVCDLCGKEGGTYERACIACDRHLCAACTADMGRLRRQFGILCESCGEVYREFQRSINAAQLKVRKLEDERREACRARLQEMARTK
jgi:anaerobic ribonucleoside-triphosphate reductase